MVPVLATPTIAAMVAAAIGILLDDGMVRALLLPATMALLGNGTDGCTVTQNVACSRSPHEVNN
jgi:hypothetical protein